MGSRAIQPTTTTAATDRPSALVLNRVGARLFAPVDIAAVVYFRILFYSIMLWDVWRYWQNGWIKEYYIDPTFHFTYYGLGWIRPLPGGAMYALFLALAALAACCLLGFRYRIAAPLFALGNAYVFLLDETTYQNHYYLVSTISILMAVLPANRALSLDARRWPALRSDTAPAWTLWLLRAQVAIPYVYGGLAKLKADWLHGQPMKMWLAANSDFPVFGRLFTHDWASYVFSWSGLLLDLFVVPALLWRPTRLLAYGAVVLFHLTNARLFPIGIFPWLMIGATAIFFPPSWPRLGGLWRPARRAPHRPPGRRKKGPAGAPTRTPGLTPTQRVTLALLGGVLAFQLLMPLRHVLYPGPVSWTEEGLRFAWHMRLRAKQGEATFFVTDPASGGRWEVDPADGLLHHQVENLAVHPDMVLQYAHHLADRWRGDGYGRVEVRAEAYAALNGRDPRPLIDPEVDLAAQPRTLRHQPWVMPLEEPLPAGWGSGVSQGDPPVGAGDR